jgi:hypothetical protein
MPELKVIVVSIVSEGVGKDGGGFIIVNGKLRRIPPRSPRLKEIDAAVTMMAEGENLEDKKIRQQLADISETVISTNVNRLVEEIGK